MVRWVAVTAPESHFTSPLEAAHDRLRETHAAIDAVRRMESAKVIAGLAPDNRGAWLMAAAKHRTIDHFWRGAMLERKHEELGRELETHRETAVAEFTRD